MIVKSDATLLGIMVMKNIFKSLIGLLMLAMSSSAWSYTIGLIDVGGVDPLIAQTNSLGCGPGSSPSAELCWINSVLDPDTTYGIKTEDVSYQFVDGSSSVIAFALSEPTEYFMIKNSTWWGLFENVSNFDWAVIDTSLLSSGFRLPDGNKLIISHVATIGDRVGVPEPGPLALLGIGLLAMTMAARRRRSR